MSQHTIELDPMQQMIQAASAIVTSKTNEANALVSQIKAAGNEAAAVSDIIEQSEDPRLAAFREWRDKANAQILAKLGEVENFVKAELLPKTDLDVEAATNQYKEIAAQVKAAQKMLATFPGGTEALTDLPSLETLRGTSGGTGSQTGVRRPRVDRILISLANEWDNVEKRVEVYSEKKNDDNTVDKVVRVGTLIAWITKDSGVKLETADVMRHFDAEAGTNDWNSLNGKPFTVSLTAGEKTYMVEVTPSTGK